MFSPIVLILLGLALAFLGRRFIWLIVGAAGFILAYDLVSWIIPGEGTLQIILATVAGVALAFLSKVAGKIILYVAGFILIGHVLLTIGGLFGISTTSLAGILFFVVGGLIGLAILRFSFDNAIIVVSALGGAALTASGLRSPELPAFFVNAQAWLPGVVGIAVAVLGFLYQWREFHASDKGTSTPTTA